MSTPVFISSVAAGFETFREAARDAVRQAAQDTSLGFEPVVFEGWAGSNRTASHECMARVDSCPIFLAIAGHRYGSIYEPTGHSVSHEEFLRALQGGKVVYAFTQEGVEFEPAQQAFVDALRKARFVRGFREPADLHHDVYRALLSYGSAGIWNDRRRELAQDFPLQALAAARDRFWAAPVLAVTAYPACARPDLFAADLDFARALANGALWPPFVPAGYYPPEAGVNDEGCTIKCQGQWETLTGFARLGNDGSAAFVTDGATDARRDIERFRDAPVGPVPARDADWVHCDPQRAQKVIWAAVKILAQWWRACPAVDGQASLAVVVTDVEKMTLFRDDPRFRRTTDPALNFLGPLPEGSGWNGPEPPGKARLLLYQDTSVLQVVSEPDAVARALVAKVWRGFRYPAVANWIPSLQGR